MKIVDYYLVLSTSRDDFNHKVGEMIKSGWQPYGSPGMCVDTNDLYYTQAMVKEVGRR